MSTSLRIAATPGGDLAHQALVRAAYSGDDAEFGRAGLRGLFGGLHQGRNVDPRTERTGEVNRPDCEQKWQSRGHPPVFSG